MVQETATVQGLRKAARAASAAYSQDEIAAILHEPIIIVSAPRAGSTLLFEQLSRVPEFWTIGGESHGVFRAFPHLRAQNRELDSGRLDRSHADRETCELMRACFLLLLRDHRGQSFMQTAPGKRPTRVTLVEKTPRNALNIEFLLEVFPTARFIYLHRDARQNTASLIEAWTVGLQTGRFVTFRDLPGWDRSGWCFLLAPDWQSMIGKSLAEIAAFQWAAANEIVLRDLSRLDRDRWLPVSYANLVTDPHTVLREICAFSGIKPPAANDSNIGLPLSRTTLTPPDPEKWRKHEAAINAILPVLERTERTIAATTSGK
ncbi:MAG: sulfotransferase family protein [Woeseiaceae bacterium]